MAELIPVDPTLVPATGVVSGAFIDPEQTREKGFRFVWEAIQHCLNTPIHDQYYWFPIEIFHVKSQLICGTMFVYSVLVGESTYSRREMRPEQIPKDHCTLREGGRRAIYQVNVWEKPFISREKEYRIRLLRNVRPNEQF